MGVILCLYGYLGQVANDLIVFLRVVSHAPGSQPHLPPTYFGFFCHVHLRGAGAGSVGVLGLGGKGEMKLKANTWHCLGGSFVYFNYRKMFI